MIGVLIFILFMLMALVGQERGVASFFTLIVNIVIGLISVYLIALGMHPLVVMIGSSALFTLVTIVCQNGINQKSMACLLAILIVVIITSLLVWYICINTHISGFTEIEIQEEETNYLSSGVNFKMRHLLILAMVWGQLGAISDTSMAVASALHEIAFHNPQFQRSKLFQEGMIIGMDILGTTINTLFFVSLGESILMYLYYRTYYYTLPQILNSSSFGQTIYMVLLPCLGCMLIIPITAAIYSYLARRTRER